MKAVIRVVSVVLLAGLVSHASAQRACEDIELTSQSDASQYVDCESARSIFAYGDSMLTSLSLPRLASVVDIYIAGNPSLTVVSLPRLTEAIGGKEDAVIIAHNGALQTIDLGALRTTPTLSVSDNGALTSVALQSLTSVPGLFSFHGNSALQTVDFSSLQPCEIEFKDAAAMISCQAWLVAKKAVCPTDCGTIDLSGERDARKYARCERANRIYAAQSGSLTSVSFPYLHAVDELDLWNNSGLLWASLPLLTATTSTGRCSFTENGGLTSLSLDSLATVNGVLDVGWNPVLAAVVLPRLTSAGMIFFQSNFGMTALSMPLLTSSGDFLISGTPVQAIDLRALRTTRGFGLVSTTLLTQLAVDSLVSVNGILSVLDNHVLKGISMSALTTTERIYITENPILSYLILPHLQTVPAIWLQDGLYIQSCQATLVSQFGAHCPTAESALAQSAPRAGTLTRRSHGHVRAHLEETIRNATVAQH